MDNVYIIPGLWVKKSTMNSDNKEIIRITGEDPKKEGYWLTTDSSGSVASGYSSLPDYVIEREYSLLQRLEYVQKPSKKLKFGDIDSEPVVKNVQQCEGNINPKHIEQELQKKEIKTVTKTQIVYKERKLEEQIFDKIKNELTDEVEFRLKVKDVPNLVKLKNAANFLDLDLKYLTDVFIDKIKDKVLESLKSVVYKELNTQESNLDDVDVVVDETNAEPEESVQESVEEPSKDEEIYEGIDEIDDFIKNL